MSKVLLLFLVATSLVYGEENKNGTTNSSPEASLNLSPGDGQFEFVGVTSGIFDSFDGKVRTMDKACLNLDYTFRKYFW